MDKIMQSVIEKYFNINTILKINGIQGGLINTTYKVETLQGDFVLQKINTSVFKNKDALLNNKIKISQYLLAANFDTVRYIPARDGNFFIEEGTDIWQVSAFIPSVVHEKITSSEMAHAAGKYLAKFHSAVLHFPISELQYTIPDFHHTTKRFHDFKASLSHATPQRYALAKDSVIFLEDNFQLIKQVAANIEERKIPLRVVHNDTKISNMLFDDTGNVLCLIDFDTLMPGSILHDIGDALRTGANTSTEEETDLSKVCFDESIYEAYIQAYMHEAQDFITEIELKSIHLSLPLLLFEQACRFLGDFLNQDIYYKTTYDTQNLIRAKTQIKLMHDVTTYLKNKNKI